MDDDADIKDAATQLYMARAMQIDAMKMAAWGYAASLLGTTVNPKSVADLARETMRMRLNGMCKRIAAEMPERRHAAKALMGEYIKAGLFDFDALESLAETANGIRRDAELEEFRRKVNILRGQSPSKGKE